jgi:glutamate dehydrogenase/leucine dehydrogenase
MGKSMPGMITGKPLSVGGSEGRDTATATGAIMVLSAYLKEHQRDPSKLTAAVQGAGNAGAEAARLLSGLGTKVIALADSRGTLLSEAGLDIAAVLKAKEASGSVQDAASGSAQGAPAEAVLETGADILVPAALEEQVMAENADRVRSSVILEIANGPVTPEADAALASRNVIVIPDVLANAGGVTVSYFEWMQNRTGERWGHAAVEAKLSEIMENAYREVSRFALERGVTLREASYALALARIVEAMRLRGRL